MLWNGMLHKIMPSQRDIMNQSYYLWKRKNVKDESPYHIQLST